MTTNRNNLGWLLAMVLIALSALAGAMPGSSNVSVAKAADSCDHTWTNETGMSGSPIRVFSFVPETCVRMTLGANEDAVVGAGDFARIVLDNGNGSPVVVHNTPHSLKAIEGPGTYIGNNLSQGFAVIVNKARALCEFNKRFTASGGAPTFTGGSFPLTAWSGQNETCGAIAADLNIKFTKQVYPVGSDGFADVIVRADRALLPGETASVTVTMPTGQKVLTLNEAHQDSVIHTQSLGEYTFSYQDSAYHATVAKIEIEVSNPSPIVGDDVTFNVTSQPAGMDVTIVLGNGQTGEIITPSALTAKYTTTTPVQWTAAVQNNGTWQEFARGNINPVARPNQSNCTAIPAKSTWSEQKNAAGHLFVLTTSGATPLRICGQLPADVTLLIQGGTVQTRTNVLTFIAGPSPVDVTLTYGLIFGSRSCLAHAKALQMKQAAIHDGNILTTIELPPADAACPVTTPPPGQPTATKIFLPLVRFAAPTYNLPAPSVYNLSAPAGEPVSSQSTGDKTVYQVVGSVPTGFTFVAWGQIEGQDSKILALRGNISLQLGNGAWAILRNNDAAAFYAARKAQYGLTDYAPPPWN